MFFFDFVKRFLADGTLNFLRVFFSLKETRVLFEFTDIVKNLFKLYQKEWKLRMQYHDINVVSGHAFFSN